MLMDRSAIGNPKSSDPRMLKKGQNGHFVKIFLNGGNGANGPFYELGES
jgi:hypothetical protein